MAIIRNEQVLECLNAGMCVVNFDDERYEIVEFWLTNPKHPGQYPTQEPPS